MSLVNVQCSNSTKTLVSSAKMIVFIGADTTKWLIKIVPASSWVRHQLVTYLSSHFHLVDIIYQSSSIHYTFYAPTHKSNSFIWSLISISFILQITVRLIHIQHIWFCSHCIVFQPHCVFHFFLTNPVSGS